MSYLQSPRQFLQTRRNSSEKQAQVETSLIKVQWKNCYEIKDTTEATSDDSKIILYHWMYLKTRIQELCITV